MKQSLNGIPWRGIALFLLCVFTVNSSATSDDDYVKVDIKVSPKQLKANSQGELVIRLKPRSGIHINLEPPIQLTLEESQSIVLLPKQPKPSRTQAGYLYTKKPVRYRFKVAGAATAVTTVIKGKLTYFYCSDEEGWCRMATEDVQVSVMIAR